MTSVKSTLNNITFDSGLVWVSNPVVEISSIYFFVHFFLFLSVLLLQAIPPNENNFHLHFISTPKNNKIQKAEKSEKKNGIRDREERD
jgi:hypothetical protein